MNTDKVDIVQVYNDIIEQVIKQARERQLSVSHATLQEIQNVWQRKMNLLLSEQGYKVEDKYLPPDRIRPNLPYTNMMVHNQINNYRLAQNDGFEPFDDLQNIPNSIKNSNILPIDSMEEEEEEKESNVQEFLEFMRKRHSDDPMPKILFVEQMDGIASKRNKTDTHDDEVCTSDEDECENDGRIGSNPPVQTEEFDTSITKQEMRNDIIDYNSSQDPQIISRIPSKKQRITVSPSAKNVTYESDEDDNQKNMIKLTKDEVDRLKFAPIALEDKKEGEVEKTQEDKESKGYNSSLGSDDDDGDNDPVMAADCKNTLICLYEKVTRTKSKWKFILKHGVAQINGKEMLFTRLNGEADF
ncbi:hypothetical protein SNEBB_005777 [Seison nebaliae]|nr:hypothetical protein SNEBB_005777 [Seison nebaliae]